jgi:hypothetical protein
MSTPRRFPARLFAVLAVAALALIAVAAGWFGGPAPTRASKPVVPGNSAELIAPAPPVPPSTLAPALSPASLGKPRAATPPAGKVKQRGMSLGLFAEDVSFDYGPLLTEIATLGATHVALVIPLYQQHGGSTRLALHTRLSPTLAATAEAVRAARRAGLEVTLFPIVRLAAPRTSNEWRGTLKPDDVDAWFESYTGQLGDLAALGAMTGASRLAIGSELSTLDDADDLPRWRHLIERVRKLFPGTLVYSANWDHYKDAAVLDLVDEAGVVAYFDLRAKDGPSDVTALAQRWRALRGEISAWRRTRAQPAQPFVFTEVGYRSRKGATAAPWDENPGGEPDLEEQRRGFEAFRLAWTNDGADGGVATSPLDLDGLYVWNWYGFGGASSAGYTPRGKPAAAEIAKLYSGM